MASESNQEKGKELVFFVRVQFRRNTSMQGAITWLDGKKSSHFRSVLELGNLIGSALSAESQKSGSKESAIGWKDKESAS